MSDEKPSSSHNFGRAFANLQRSVATPVREPRDLSGIIKDFEMTYELSWKVLKKALLTDGHATLGAKDVYTQAFRLGYINVEDVWLQMIVDRNQTAHVYDEAAATLIVNRVRTTYLPAFADLLQRLGITTD